MNAPTNGVLSAGASSYEAWGFASIAVTGTDVAPPPSVVLMIKEVSVIASPLIAQQCKPAVLMESVAR